MFPDLLYEVSYCCAPYCSLHLFNAVMVWPEHSSLRLFSSQLVSIAITYLCVASLMHRTAMHLQKRRRKKKRTLRRTMWESLGEELILQKMVLVRSCFRCVKFYFSFAGVCLREQYECRNDC